MPNRLVIVITVLIWYATVRYAIYYYFIPNVLLNNGKLGAVTALEWWFAWFLAIPVTALSIILVWVAVKFIWCGDILCR